MKREIKFRAWDIKEKIMADDADARFWLSQGFDEIFPDDYAFMQYTGLKDKNGKEIFEGDIVRFHYFYGTLGDGMGFVESEHELTGVIEWGAFGWGLSAIKGEHWRGYTGYEDGEGESNLMELMSMNESSIHEESFEIIGNIYENPSLIKRTNYDTSK